MKTRNLLLFAFMLFISAGLCAQVTIGSANNPKDGAILDLNNGAQGGLILSNVNLTDPGVIPDDFPGMDVDGLDMDAVKEQLKGAMIYNTNEVTCIGIYVWNGVRWARIGSEDNPIEQGEGTLVAATGVLAGTEIRFDLQFPSPPSGINSYTWYVSWDNGLTYECIGSSKDPSFSKKLSGSGRVKVVYEVDCQYGKEKEIPFTMVSYSPSFGSTAGGNTIYISGSFDYAATSDYISKGLVAHYDAINNQNLGDKSHSYTATNWKDLKSTGDLTLEGTPDPNDGWKNNAFKLSAGTYFKRTSVPDLWPKGGSDRTIEITFRTPAAGWNKADSHGLFDYGTAASSRTFGIIYRYYSDGDNRFYFISGFSNNYYVKDASVPALYEDSKLNTVTSTYSTNVSNPKTKGILNGVPINPVSPGTSALNTGTTYVNVGWIQNSYGRSPGFEISSIRLYNRVLDDDEIQHNAELDQIRYLVPPTVKIGDGFCTEVVVLSPNFLMCKVPAGTEGTAEVKMTVGGVESPSLGNYKYVNASTGFYISEIIPLSDFAGQILTLKGHNLTEEIGKVEVGAGVCAVYGIPTTAEYKCTLPANPKGETDIVITLKDNTTVHRFAKVFEYK